MGTTIVVCVVAVGEVLVANVGDSRCYRLIDDMLVQLSVDDSPAPPAGVDVPHRSGRITQVLGGRGAGEADPHIAVVPTMPGDRYLLCSDGLTGAVDLDQIESLVAEQIPPEAVVARLLEAALAAGADDNVSVVVIDL